MSQPLQEDANSKSLNAGSSSGLNSSVQTNFAPPPPSQTTNTNLDTSTDMPVTSPPPSTPSSEPPAGSAQLLEDQKMKEILHSDVGIESLISRMKQSVHSVREFSVYLKKMAQVETEYSVHLKKTSKTVTDAFKRPEIRKGTFQSQILGILKSTDRYGDAGNAFIEAVHKIHDELQDLVRNMDRQRKLSKETALRHEKNLMDAEREVEKAKSKYDSACEDLEKARTSDPSKNKLGFKNKSEEELHRRMTVCEVDYQQKVDICQNTRRELVEKLRVQDVKKLQGLILECDNALGLQILRFSNLFETLQLNRGFVISPIAAPNSQQMSVKGMAAKMDSELDFYNYVCGIAKKKSTLNRAPVVFKKHPTLGRQGNSGSSVSAAQTTPAPKIGGTSQYQTVNQPRVSGAGGAGSGAAIVPSKSTFISGGTAKTGPVLSPSIGSSKNMAPLTASSASNSNSVSGTAASSTSSSALTGPGSIQGGGNTGGNTDITSSSSAAVAPSASTASTSSSVTSSATTPTGASTSTAPPVVPNTILNPGTNTSSSTLAPTTSSSGPSSAAAAASTSNTNIPSPGTPLGLPVHQPAKQPTEKQGEIYDPSKHGLAVFGTPLEDLLDYEEGTVPRVVYQCVQAIDNFGLEVEGIYRTNGNSAQIAEIRREFDIDATAVDLLRPNNGVNDIHSVASALKQYFLALPDPLLTKEFHKDFINAASIKEDIRRRDSVHAVINKLPDPNYTTLRYLIFHLYRVQEREQINKMSVSNLSIVWGPALMDTDYQNISEMAIQSQVVETIVLNAYAIFEAE